MKAFVELKTSSLRGKEFHKLGATREKEEVLNLLPFLGGFSPGG